MVSRVLWKPATLFGHLASVRWLVIVTLICIETLSLVTVSTATRMHYIHWNTTNPIFRIDNTDHIIDVNRNNIPFEYDQVNIICPVYAPGTHEDDAEKYIIYNVSKEEYDTCRITNPNPRIIAVCDKPYKLMYFTITFRSFTPQPGGLEFRPGQDYYFISTSSRDDLHRRIGGRCSSHNMKVVFKVCCKPDDMDKGLTTLRPAQAPMSPAAVIPAAATTTTLAPVTSSPTTTAPTTTTTRKTTTTSPTTSRIPIWKEMEIQSFSVRPVNKKTDDYDKLSNEVVKNEELSSKSGGGVSVRRSANPVAVGVALLLLPLLWLR